MRRSPPATWRAPSTPARTSVACCLPLRGHRRGRRRRRRHRRHFHGRSVSGDRATGPARSGRRRRGLRRRRHGHRLGSSTSTPTTATSTSKSATPTCSPFGVHSGAEGFDSDFNVGVVGGHVGSNADGSFDIGADRRRQNWGPLPNFGAHVAEDSGGDVGVSGRGRVYIEPPRASSAARSRAPTWRPPKAIRGVRLGDRPRPPARPAVTSAWACTAPTAKTPAPTVTTPTSAGRRGRHRGWPRGTRHDRLQRGPRG